jgi:hypothetical protein
MNVPPILPLLPPTYRTTAVNASWKSCSVRVFSIAYNLPWSPHLCQNRGLSVLSSVREIEKRWRGASRMGDNNHVVLVKKIPCESIVVKRQPVLLSPKFGAKPSHIFTVAVKCHSSMRNSLFDLKEWILCEQSPWRKKNDKYALDFALHLSRHFWSWSVWIFHVWLMFSSPNACLIIVRVSVPYFPRFAQNSMAVSFSDPSRNHITSHIWPQIC